MESMNKFKILTIIVIAMFLFVIAAIYSNTKDATSLKQKSNLETVKNEIKDEIQTDNVEISQNNETLQDLTTQIENLNRRVDELSQRTNGSSDGSTALTCRIIGVMGDTGVEQLTEEAALQEARVNNRQVVITCSL